jgi:hypothetical protein
MVRRKEAVGKELGWKWVDGVMVVGWGRKVVQ